MTTGILIQPDEYGVSIQSSFDEEETIAILSEGLGALARQMISDGTEETEITSMISYHLAQTLYPKKHTNLTPVSRESN